MVLAEEARFVDVAAILAGRFVAVVAVGDEDRLGPDHGGHGGNGANVGYRPNLAHHAQVIGRHDRGQAADRLVQNCLGLVGRIGIEAENLAQVGLRRGHQHQPVDLGTGQGLFVRKDLPFAERRQPQPGHETAAIVGHALGRELLMIDVNRRIGIRVEHAFRLPVLVEPLGPRVAVVDLVVVARLDLVEDQADDVIGALLVEFGLEFRADDVVGRGDHVAQRSDLAKVVANGTKGLNLRHCGSVVEEGS